MCSIGQDLSKALAQPLVIVGVGNPMRGDDGFGPALAERLKTQGINATVVNAEITPENYLGYIASLQPALVLVADAVDFGGRPGELRLIEPRDIVHTGASTHAASLALIEKFLSPPPDDPSTPREPARGVPAGTLPPGPGGRELHKGTRTIVLAVQPKSVKFGGELSKEVGDAIHHAEQIIKASLRNLQDPPPLSR